MQDDIDNDRDTDNYPATTYLCDGCCSVTNRPGLCARCECDHCHEAERLPGQDLCRDCRGLFCLRCECVIAVPVGDGHCDLCRAMLLKKARARMPIAGERAVLSPGSAARMGLFSGWARARAKYATAMMARGGF